MVEMRYKEIAYRDASGTLKSKEVLQYRTMIHTRVYGEVGGGGSAPQYEFQPKTYWSEWQEVKRVSFDTE